MIEVATLRDVDVLDGSAVADLAEELAADLVVVGPEAPLVAGVADVLRERGISCFGPSAAAARLEGSKAYAKEVMAAAGVPTAGHTVGGDVDARLAALLRYPALLKAGGVAAGQGGVIAPHQAGARPAPTRMLGHP